MPFDQCRHSDHLPRPVRALLEEAATVMAADIEKQLVAEECVGERGHQFVAQSEPTVVRSLAAAEQCRLAFGQPSPMRSLLTMASTDPMAVLHGTKIVIAGDDRRFVSSFAMASRRDASVVVVATAATGRIGYGLGLAMTKKVVDAHDGSILVESAASGGARFVIEMARQPGGACAELLP